jgi:Chromate transport protein ChrA
LYWIVFFFTLLKSILFSSGGYGPLPSLHSDLISNGWANQKQFSDSMTIGQITPGPNGFWVISLCYLVAGWRGAGLACIALILPPLLILLIQRAFKRIVNFPSTQGVMDGVVLVISTFGIIVVLQIFVGNGIDLLTVGIAAVSAILAISRRVSTNIILLAAIVIGLFIH